MQTTALQLGLALQLLIRGPLCGVLCDVSGLHHDAPWAEAAHHGAAEAPCHGPSPSPEPAEPASPHGDCAACDGFALARAGGHTPGSNAAPVLVAPMSPTTPGAFAQDLPRPWWAPDRPPPRNLLLLKSTLLI